MFDSSRLLVRMTFSLRLLCGLCVSAVYFRLRVNLTQRRKDRREGAESFESRKLKLLGSQPSQMKPTVNVNYFARRKRQTSRSNCSDRASDIFHRAPALNWR